MSVTPDKPLPLSHPLRVETITLRPVPVEVVADAAALPAIARHLAVASVEMLKASYSLSRNGERLKLTGRIDADLRQICVVTLDPFPVRIRSSVELDFQPQAEVDERARPGREDEDEIDLEILLNEDDPPESIVDGRIDLGAVTLEFLSLELDPYPRKPGVAFADVAPEPEAESPFAALARLRRED